MHGILLLIALVKEAKVEALFGYFQDPKAIDAFYCLCRTQSSVAEEEGIPAQAA